MCGAVALWSFAGPALAAPEQFVSQHSTQASFVGKNGSGMAYTEITPLAPLNPRCAAVTHDCETTLVRVDDAGRLFFRIYPRLENAAEMAANNAALFDIDLHIYESDSTGAQKVHVGSSLTAGSEEAVYVSRGKVGYYLVVVEWYLGTGDYTGSVQLVPAVTA